MMIVRVLSLVLIMSLAACVQTGGATLKPDLDEASRLNTQLGMSYLQQGNLDVALSKFQKAIEQNDDQAQAYWGLALVHARFQEPERALGYFKDALKKDPEDANILASYGEFQCARGDVQAAQDAFLQALETPRYLTPEIAYTNAGACYLSQGQRIEADKHFRKALNYNPRYSRALMQLASMSFDAGDYLRARAFIQRLDAQSAQSAESLLLGLRTEYALGDTRALQRYAAQLRSRYPEIAKRFDLSNGRNW